MPLHSELSQWVICEPPGGTSALISMYSEQGTLLLFVIFRVTHVKWGTGNSHSTESPLVS